MAEVSIKATLVGAAEAQRGLQGLAAATKELTAGAVNEATVLSNLARVQQEYQTGLQSRTAATQRLKDHTNELVRKFQEQEQAERAAQSAASQLTSSIGGMVGRFAAATFSVTALVGTFWQIFNAGREANLTLIKLQAALEATGGTVGKTAQQLEEMAAALAKGTRFDNTGIQQAMQVLLTFDNVTGDVFESAIRHAQNLSEKFGMDLSSAARLLGRALQEPGQGLQALQRYLGTLNPELVKHIQNLDDMGRSYEARQEIIKLLDGRMKDFAKTVGESAPASFDKMKIAWHNLMEELGKGTVGDIGSSIIGRITNNLDALRSYFETFDEWRKRNTMRIIEDELRTVEQGSARWLELNQRMQELQQAEADKVRKEEQAQQEAILAENVKRWDEEAQKKKAFREKQLKENEELTKKIMADEEAATRTRLELINLEVKQRKMTLEQKVQLLDEEMTYQAQGTAIWIALSKERLSALDDIDRREDTNIKRVLDRYDVDIKMGKATFQQKILFLDELLSKEEEGTEAWIALMKARQQTEDQMVAKKKQGEAEIEKALKKTQRAFAEQAEDKIDLIRKEVFATEDLRLEALDQLAASYQSMGADGEEAYDRVRKAMRNVETTAERNTKRLQSAIGEAGFDMINVIGDVNSAWTSTFADMLHGASTFSEMMKSLWKGIIDAIIQEIARMVSQWILAQLRMKALSMGLSFIGSVLGFAFGGPAGALAGGAIGGGVNPSQMGGDMIASSPTTFLVGEGGVAARSFQLGGEGVFTSPTLFRAGEGRPERVRVTPLAGAASGDSGGSRITNVFNGPNVMDAFSLRRFVRQQERLIVAEMRRG